jgi:putative heme-binding domain-containing protein
MDRALALALQLPPEAGAEVLLAVARAGGAEFQSAFHVFWHMLARREWERAVPPQFHATMLRALELSVLRQGEPSDTQRAAVKNSLEILTPMPGLHAAEVFVRFGVPNTIPRYLGYGESAASQEERLHYLFTLRHMKSGWTLEQRRAWIAAFRHESARAVGAHHMGVTLRYCRTEFEADLSDEERTALASDLATLDPSATAIPAAEARAFVKAWTQADLEPHLPAVAAPERDLKRGGKLFASQCAACHRFGPQGGVIGPDLTGIAGRFDRRTILESVLDPWRVVAAPYQIATATLKSGEIVSGPVLGDDGTSLSLNVNPVDADRARHVRRDETTALTITSLMPPGLANTFSEEELLDLLAWMERGGPAQ